MSSGWIWGSNWTILWIPAPSSWQKARVPGRLPIPVSLMASGAAQHDLPVAKQIVEDHAFLKPGYLYADKAYIDADWAL